MSLPSIIKLNDRISYIPASETPLSSHVGIVKGDRAVYLYDVGATFQTLDFLHLLDANKPVSEDACACAQTELSDTCTCSQTELPDMSVLADLLGKPYDITVSHFHGDHAWWLEKHYEGESGVKPGDTISLNYERPRYRNLYVSKESAKHTCRYGEREGVGEACRAQGGKENVSVGEACRAQGGKENASVGKTCRAQGGKENASVGKTLSERGHDVVLSNVTSERVVIEDGVRIEIIPMPSTHAKGCLAMMVDDEYLFVGDATYGAMKDGAVLFNSQLLKAQIDLLRELPAKKILLSHDDKFVRPKAVVLRQLEAVYEKRSKEDPYIRISEM